MVSVIVPVYNAEKYINKKKSEPHHLQPGILLNNFRKSPLN